MYDRLAIQSLRVRVMKGGGLFVSRDFISSLEVVRNSDFVRESLIGWIAGDWQWNRSKVWRKSEGRKVEDVREMVVTATLVTKLHLYLATDWKELNRRMALQRAKLKGLISCSYYGAFGVVEHVIHSPGIRSSPAGL